MVLPRKLAARVGGRGKDETMRRQVSVIIPCFNMERWIGAAIDSALQQSWPATEVIVIDDGSTDQSPSIIRSRESDPRMIVSTQRNRGQSAALNAGLALAEGEFIQFLDADDLLAPNKVEAQLKRLLVAPPGHIASARWARFESDHRHATFHPEGVWQDMSAVEWLVTSWEGGGMMHGAAWLIPRKLIQAAGPWNESLSLINDFDYFTRVLLHSAGVLFCDQAATYYRSAGPGRLSGMRSRPALDSAFRSLQLGTRELLAHEDSPRTRHAAAVSFQRFVYSYYPDSPDLMSLAEDEVRRLGGCNLPIPGGRRFQWLARLMGWKRARQLQRYATRRP